MPSHWYTLHSQPNKEDLLWQQVSAHGYDSFYPRIKVQTVNPRARKIRPYFPGYMFVHVDLETTGLSTFQWMPYGTGLVCFGGEPATVPEALINALRRKMIEIAESGGELFNEVKKGDPVIIQGGPFEGYEAIFDIRLPGSERVRVLLKMLSSRTLPIEMDAGNIRPLKKRRY